MRSSTLLCVALSLGAALTLSSCKRAESWSQLRGPRQGHAEAKGVPVEWSESKNVKWKTALQILAIARAESDEAED